MKHRIGGRKLGRTSDHRKAMLSNMATSLFKSYNDRIMTTLAKAKELKRFVEPIITRAKIDSLHNKRLLMKKIKNRKVLLKLFENIAPRYANRPGGYTRIIHLANRKGDNSKMAYIELVEEALIESQATIEKKSQSKKTEEKVSTDKTKTETKKS